MSSAKVHLVLREALRQARAVTTKELERTFSPHFDLMTQELYQLFLPEGVRENWEKVPACYKRTTWRHRLAFSVGDDRFDLDVPVSNFIVFFPVKPLATQYDVTHVKVVEDGSNYSICVHLGDKFLSKDTILLPRTTERIQSDLGAWLELAKKYIRLKHLIFAEDGLTRHYGGSVNALVQDIPSLETVAVKLKIPMPQVKRRAKKPHPNASEAASILVAFKLLEAAQ